ncbi:hypothetical protein LX32DRAFT_318942 [Colletotrichum zoysiae]|uniref:Uncharacterized protein n=1 Tax=Colletotrichum zoysiae TaxID=1216348 RepID=A0AAD9H1S9_9PEZI|nr:hypothetical protein LX32DRAFT_318942 [Colletotrichum zoysiae]
MPCDALNSYAGITRCFSFRQNKGRRTLCDQSLAVVAKCSLREQDITTSYMSVTGHKCSISRLHESQRNKIRLTTVVEQYKISYTKPPRKKKKKDRQTLASRSFALVSHSRVSCSHARNVALRPSESQGGDKPCPRPLSKSRELLTNSCTRFFRLQLT